MAISRGRQLKAIQKIHKVEKQEILQKKLLVEKVLEERKTALEHLNRRKQKLIIEFERVSELLKQNLTGKADLKNLKFTKAYQASVKGEMRIIDNQIKAKDLELTTAKQRSESLKSDLINKDTESKKIEKSLTRIKEEVFQIELSKQDLTRDEE